MSPTPRRARASARTVEAVEGLLRDLGSQLERGSQALAREVGPRRATGLPDIDELVGGGFPTGRLSEITGPASSGRTSVTQALLTRATNEGEAVALVDLARGFDPESARGNGIALERVLWVRPPGLREAMRCCQCLLEARGFELVLLDLAEAVAPPASTWQRLARTCAGTSTPLLVSSPAHTTGAHADLVLAMQPDRAHFSGTPVLLEALSFEAQVTRRRSGMQQAPARRVASLRLSA